MRPLAREKCWPRWLRFCAEGLLTGLRCCGKGWSIGLRFSEHLTVRGVASKSGLCARLLKWGMGGLEILGKGSNQGFFKLIRANFGLLGVNLA